MRIPIATAFICLDCECFTENNIRCDCGSERLFAYAPIMNRVLPDRTLTIDSNGLRVGDVTVEWMR